MRLYTIQKDKQKLNDLRQLCAHLEPNYGVLWFYYRNSPIENALDVWDRAQKEISQML